MPYKSALNGRVLGVRWTGAPTAIDVDRLEAETHSGFGRASAPLVLVAVPRSLTPPDADVRARFASMMRATAAQIERFYLVIEGSGPRRALARVVARAAIGVVGWSERARVARSLEEAACAAAAEAGTRPDELLSAWRSEGVSSICASG
ncbi:hypothetical protein [Sandaracinus amylolyticus]|uniref:hypothetical protein n=1 Tax=Sandaracinus amylolyticus TaxID=927083 RepID=UPI001F2A7715|nr:hypothetical protein [Sandaracinus amylolyticus]UJR83110.1 Hypothetical protein I5071_51760 [Sandaracinus amylolyticus]